MAAATFPELLRAAGLAVTRHLAGPDPVDLLLRDKIVLRAPSLDSLFEVWVLELLRLYDTQQMVFEDFGLVLRQAGPLWELSASLLGSLQDRRPSRPVTLYHAKLTEKNPNYHAKLTLGS